MILSFAEYIQTLKLLLHSDILVSQVFWGNSLGRWLGTLGVWFVLFLAFFVFQRFVLMWIKRIVARTKNDIDDTLFAIVRRVRPSFYLFLAFYISLNVLYLPGFFMKILMTILLLWTVHIVVVSFDMLMDYIAQKRFDIKKETSSITAMKTLSVILKVLLWGIGLLLIMANLGIDVTSLVAGLGIGGIAIALAVQNILGDLFSSFAILFDKPFVVGDFIVLGDKSGTVESIGIKTTRIKSLQGEEIVVSNKNLVNESIHNFKKLKRRRVSFIIGITYETSLKKLKQITAIVEKIFSTTEKVTLYSVHFSEFGDSSLNFNIIYYVESGEYQDYLNARQQILFGIKEIFDKKDIDFAYPTQTVFLHSDNKK